MTRCATSKKPPAGPCMAPVRIKITAIESGGDWYDAAVNYLVLPEGMDFDEQRHQHRQWDQSGAERFVSLHEWLISRGAREPTDDELEIVSDD